MEKYDLIFSLGGSCATAKQLKMNGLRNASYPFDWLFCLNDRHLKYLINAFQTDFHDWLLYENLRELTAEERGDSKCFQYCDEVSGYNFIHDFHKPKEDITEYTEVKDKYKRRINRLLEKISKSKNILIIFDARYDVDISLLKELKKVIENKYKRTHVKFILLQFCAKESKCVTKKWITIYYIPRNHTVLDYNSTPDEWKFVSNLKLNNSDVLKTGIFTKLLVRIITGFIPIKKYRKKLRDRFEKKQSELAKIQTTSLEEQCITTEMQNSAENVCAESNVMTLEKYKENIAGILFNYDDLKIVHAYARFYNFGDNALAFGVKNIFLKYFNNNIRFINEDVHTTVFNKEKLKEINKKADILLVGGGGLIHTYDSEFWLFNMPDSDINTLTKPLILYGLGYNNFCNIPLNEKAIENIRNIQNKAVSFSVRNDGSAERLAEYDLNFDEVPDPGFFVDANHPKPNIKGKYVMLQIAYDSANLRNVDNDNFFNNMTELCRYLLDKGYSVVLSPHCYPDIDISNKIVETVNNKKCFSWNWHEIMREDNVSVGLGYYKYADFVIAMRGHAQICPIGMNVPVISVINHPKHLGLLQKNNLETYVFTDEDFSRKIKEKISYVIDNKEKIKDKYAELMTDFNSKTQNYLNELKLKVLK